MEVWLLLLSSSSSWCTQRQWWKTHPPACLCWRFRLQIQTWELMARSPTPCTVPTQTSSISTPGQVWRCLFGVKTRVLPPKWTVLSVWAGETSGTQQLLREALCSKQNKNISAVISFFFPRFWRGPHWHSSYTMSVITSFSHVYIACKISVCQFLG